MTDSTDNARGLERIAFRKAYMSHAITSGPLMDHPDYVQYVRADLAPDPLTDPRVVALVDAMRRCPPCSNPTVSAQEHLSSVNLWWANWARPALAALSPQEATQMDDVKRYRIGPEPFCMSEYDEGPWIEYDDYAYLRARLAEVEKQRDEALAEPVDFSEMAAAVIEEMSKNHPRPTWGQIKGAMRALGDVGDRQAYQRMKARAERAEAALQLVKRMIDEALPKFNWGASFLDANAITLLNEAPIAVNQALALIEKEPKT